MSLGKNNIVRSVNPKSTFESAINVIDSSTSFNQGDLLVFDTVTRTLRIAAVEGDGATFCGVARCSVVSGKLASPYQGTAVDAAQAISDVPGPLAGVICKLTLKTGDSLNAGQIVFLHPATGTDGVQSAGTVGIGVYQGKTIAAAPAGTKVEVLLVSQLPV